MAKKSRYQMTNRGRKHKPSWYVEDFAGLEGKAVGKYMYSNRSRQIAEGFLKQLRDQEKKFSVELAGVPAQLPPGLHSAKVGAVMVSSGGFVSLVADMSCARPVESVSLMEGAQFVGRVGADSLMDDAERMFYKDQAEWGPLS